MFSFDDLIILGTTVSFRDKVTVSQANIGYSMIKEKTTDIKEITAMTITKDIKYIGVNDRNVDLFEGQYPVPNGIAYNSYVILDEKIAVMDTVDIGFTREWMANLQSALAGRPNNINVWSYRTETYQYLFRR